MCHIDVLIVQDMSSLKIGDYKSLNARFSETGFLFLANYLNGDQILFLNESIGRYFDFTKAIDGSLKHVQFLDSLAELCEIKKICQIIGFNDPYIAQLTIDIKPPGKKGHSPHTDNFYLGSEKIDSAAIYIALSPAGVSEGAISVCLKNKPGEYKRQDTQKGDVLIWHGNTLHCSGDNVSKSNRPSIILHVVNGRHSSILKKYKPLVLLR